MNSGTITNQLLDAVQVLVDDAVKKAEFDRTVQAVIAKCVSATKGQYSVKYQGGFFYAYAQDPSITYTPETQVYVLIPGNDMNKTKTILGTVEKLGENFISEAESSIYENVGNNICSDAEGTVYGLHSYYITDNIVLYERGTTPTTDFNIDAEAANLYLKNADYLMIAAKFRTNLPQEHRVKGNYGLKYTLTFTDPLTGENVDRTYVLDINNMLGNPYAQAVAMRQVLPFEIDSENFQHIKKIEIFSKDFTTVADLSKPADIFISDIELNGALTVPVDEGTGYILSLITKQGIYFKENDDLSSTRRIEAELYKDGEKQNITTNDVIYYWFKEDGSIYYNTPGFLKYGGQGWRCINDTTEDGKFLPGNSYIEVSKLYNPAKENNYKCVVVFKNTTLYMDREITIYNQSSNYTVTLSSDVSNLSDAATAHLTCEVTGTLPGHTITYSWSKVVDNRLPAEFISESNSSALEVDLREAIKNVVYKCTAKDSTDNIYLGSDSVAITRGSEETAGYYYISMINDNQIFKYDTHGDSPTSISLINPQIINPLSFTLYDPDGQAVSYEDIGASNINWVIPDEETSMIVNAEPMSTYNEKLGFDIKGKYNINAINNTIEVEVFYDNKTIRGKANLIFLKEGENGSNGTSYYLNVVPNYSGDNAPNGKVFYYYRNANNQGFNFTPIANKFPFRTLFYRDGDIIYDSSRDQDNVQATIAYDFVKRIYFTDKTRRPYVTYSDDSRFEIDGNDIDCIDTTLGDQAGEYSADILRCTFEYEGLVWYYYYPIIFVKYDANASNCEIVIPETSGFTEVIYTEDGRNPQYKGSNTFDIDVYRNYEKISSEVDWEVQGQIYTSEWQEEANLIAGNENEFNAKEAYNGNCVTNALYGEVSDGTNLIAEIHFPIAMYLNTYANEFINEWNGNAIELNEEGGIILTPQIAAGQKENDNTFTGVVGGKAKEATSDTIDEGIFGYNHGERTFELNAEDGSAKFGKAGAGQIIISPDEDNAHSVLQSGNYVAPVLTPGGEIETEGQGLQIDLTAPSIIFGSGKFRVDSDGTVHATEYATTASLADGSAVIAPASVTGLTNTMDTVTDLDNTITKFQVDLNRDSVIIPCDSTKKTTNGVSYTINAILTYKGTLITTYNVNNLTITPPSGVTSSDIEYIKSFSSGVLTITFTTKGTTLTNLTNDYTCSFYYPTSQETVTKKITLGLAPKGEAGAAGTSPYISYLTNEAQMFAYGTATTITTQLYAYQGTTEKNVTIKKVNGVTASTSETNTGLTGMKFKVNSTSAAAHPTISFISTTALPQTQAVQVPIIYQIDGESSDRTIYFSYSTTTRGATGQSSYTHIKYATDDQGTNMSDDPTGKTYIGIKIDNNPDASTTPSDYTWTKYVGDNGTNGSDGFSLWTTNDAPTNNVYTRSQLTGPSATQTPRVGEIIIRQNRYQYTISAVSGNNITVGTAVDLRGSDARIYEIVASNTSIVKKVDDTYAPTSITFTSYYRNGTTATQTSYAGRWLIQHSIDGTNWDTDYTSNGNEASKAYTIPTNVADLKLIRVYLGPAGTTPTISNALDVQTIPILNDSTDIEIGGRNLALDTKKLSHSSDYDNRYAGNYSTATKISRQDEFVEVRCLNILRGLSVYLNDMDLQVGDTVNLQAMVRNENVVDNFTISLYLMESNSSGTRVYVNTPLSVLGGTSTTGNSITLGKVNIGEIKKVSVAITWNQDLQDLIDEGGKVNATIQTGTTFTGTDESYIAMWALKLEKGNVPTDWSPAPEDTDSVVSDLVSDNSDLLIFKQNQEDIINPRFREDIDNNFDASIIETYNLYKEIPYTYTAIAANSNYDANIIYYKENQQNQKQKIDPLDILDYFPMPTDGPVRQLINGITLYQRNIPNAPSQLHDGDSEEGWLRNKNAWQDESAIYTCVAVKYGDNHKDYSVPVLLTDYQSIEDKRYQQGNEVLLNTKGYTRVFWKDQEGIFVYDSDTEASSLRRIVINSRGINYATRTSFHATQDTNRQNNKDYYEQDPNIATIYYLVSDWTSRKLSEGVYNMSNLYEEDLHRYAKYADFPQPGQTNNYYYARLENEFYKYTTSYVKMTEAQIINQFPAWETSSVWGIEGAMNLKRMDVNYLRADEIADGILTLGSSAADGKLVIQNDEENENFQLASERFECALYNNTKDVIGYIYIGQDIGLQCVSIDGTIRYGNNLTWHTASGTYQNNVNYYASQNLNSLKTDVVVGNSITGTVYTCSCDKIFNLTNEKVYEDITFMNGQTEVIKTQTLVFDETVGTSTYHHKGIGFITG